MKLFLLLILLALSSCSRKYQTYHTIEKSNFKFNDTTEKNLITPKLYPGEKVTKKFCQGQILWMNNAIKQTEEKVNDLVRYSCPENQFIMNSKITETWWTVIFYSKACIELETYCPRKK